MQNRIVDMYKPDCNITERIIVKDNVNYKIRFYVNIIEYAIEITIKDRYIRYDFENEISQILSSFLISFPASESDNILYKFNFDTDEFQICRQSYR
jgi:hypothetical protein